MFLLKYVLISPTLIHINPLVHKASTLDGVENQIASPDSTSAYNVQVKILYRSDHNP